MAKKAILEVLESTIGRYVHNLDPTTLNVAVFAGQIQLSSLSLDTDAVNSELGRRAREAPNLACPFRVDGGYFENVSLDVPWARLSSRPVVFRARGLRVEMSPHDFLNDCNSSGHDVSDSLGEKAKKERKHSLTEKETARKRANVVRMALEDDSDGANVAEGQSSSTFTSRLVRRIVENLQFEIEDVHISIRGCGVSAGVVLGSLSLVTTDVNGVRTFVDRQTSKADPGSSFLYKELLISAFGIYLQPDEHVNVQQYITRQTQHVDMEYVLSPLSFQAKLRQSDLDNCVDFPKYLVHSKLSSLSIGLSRTQLELGHRLVLAVKPQHGIRPLFPEYRPLVSVEDDPKQWWQYASRCIGRLNRRRSWLEFYSAFQKRKVYVDLYKRYTHAEGTPWLLPLTDIEKRGLNKIENDRSISVEGLMHWRNLADGQAEREREKMLAKREQTLGASVGGSESTPSKSRYRLFGTPKKEVSRKDSIDTDFYESLDDENAAPITLTADEMKELEDLAMKKVDQTLTKDSMLCDINFTLNSFQVNLTNVANQQITSLEMEVVSMSFKAKADGSFGFGLSLLSLEISDNITVDTFYPTICRSLQKSRTKQSQAFQLQMTKSKGGDQELVLKMVACEIVASPLLLYAVVEFFKLPVPFIAANPMLLETVGGEKDMFFDARERESTVLKSSPMRISTTALPSESPIHHSTAIEPKDGKVSDKLSSAILDAWNGKNQKKLHWKIDMDISAPILILPEDCVNADATSLICNFGRFKFTYGSVALSSSVVEWFDAHQRINRIDSEIDHLKLNMNDLSFTISSVGDASKNGLEGLNCDISTSIISPVSFTLDIGLEHTISSIDSTPRTCVIGVLPAIILRLGPSHVTKVLRVAGIWSSNLRKLRDDVHISVESSSLYNVKEEEKDLEIISSGSGISLLEDNSNGNIGEKEPLIEKDRFQSLSPDKKSLDSTPASEFIHISLSLLRLSLNIYTSNGDGVEAHLVSVKTASSVSTDGSSSTRLCVGYFWVLDRLESELKLPRRRRLVCHSSLPQSASVYAENEKYEAIMSDLTRQGVFASEYSGSTDLADIHIKKLPSSKVQDYHDSVTGFSQEYINYVREVEKVTIVDAKFTSLFINWNPHAIKSLFAAKEQLSDFKQKAYSTYENISARQVDPKVFTLMEANDDMVVDSSKGDSSIFILAQMDTFEISLNSAKDDLPLFIMTMCDSKINRHVANEFNSEMDLVVGDLRIETPALGRTLDSYRTILGLAPSVATSLLSLKYAKGSNAVSSCDVGGANKLECEACAIISLSPMRFVHLHSQVFTLIDYVSDGVFGAMAASVASTAAAAAMEVTKSAQNGERLFYIVASGFDFVLPRAAYSENFFVFHTGELEAHYRTLENDAGSLAQLTLRDLSLSCDQQMHMVSNPVNLTVSVQMKPPTYQGTEDERATKVDMSTNRIRILMAQCHYAQMMHTLDFNIGETNNFLRSDLSITRSLSIVSSKEEKSKSLTETTVDSILKNLSHAGVQSIIVVKRMYIIFNIQELSLELCGIDTEDDPIVSIAAVNAEVTMKLLPDQKQTRGFMTLHDLVCDDRRLGAYNRTFRRMVGRAGVGRHHHTVSSDTVNQDEEHVFQVNYIKNTEDLSRLIEVKLGSSQVVVLPDVISDMLKWINVPNIAPPNRIMNRSFSSRLTDQSNGGMQVVITDDDPEAVEACFGGRVSMDLKTTKYIIHSSNMRLVLVDIGSMDSFGSFVTSKPSSTLTETIVLQGKMQASFDMTKDTIGESTVEKDYKIDAQRVEIYTAQGVDLLHPIQLLEPAKFSLFYYQNVGHNSSQHITDVKFVTLTPIDVTVSMQNIALANTLANSISDSFGSSDDVENDTEFHNLSSTDAKRISRLDSALARDSDQLTHASEHMTEISMYSNKEVLNKKRVVKMKMTSPEATFTVTNDFQGLDEALFKVIAMNFVLGAEIDYPTGTSLEKPLFDFNTNTSILADYFDAASNRWETLLSDPWEITFNGSRSPQKRFDTNRMSTTFDIESNPCNVSFSEHFLVNVGAASRMWSVYSGAINKATALVDKGGQTDVALRKSSRSMAAHAARSLITTLPYAIENHSGINAYYSIYKDPIRIPLPTSSTQFFQFELFPGNGSGGLRRYGQDVKHSKSIVLYVGNTKIAIHDMDKEIHMSRSAHYISDYKTHLFTSVEKKGNSTVLHLSSHVEIYNLTSLQFRISIIADESVHDLGLVEMTQDHISPGTVKSQSLLHENEELMTHSVFGLPAQFLRSFTVDNSETLCIQVSPILEGSSTDLVGMFNIFQLEQLVEMATSDCNQQFIEVSCHPVSQRSSSPHSSLAVNVCFNVCLVDDAHPFVQLSITPRLILTNRLPIDVMLRTPMPHTFYKKEASYTEDYRIIDKNFTIHEMKPLGSIEIFTPGPSIAISMCCADLPIGGTTTDWMSGGWLDLPLGSNKKLPEPVKTMFPFKSESLIKYSSSRQLSGQPEGFGMGSEFFVVEADDVTPDLSGEKNIESSKKLIRTVVVMVCNYAVDHTGNLLFEEVPDVTEPTKQRRPSTRMSPPFSAFSSAKLRRRVSLLPTSSKYIRLVELTMDGEDGMKRSMPFRVDDVSMTCGIDSMPILWTNHAPSGYFAYRNLTAEGAEIHVVPEFVLFNGSHHHQIWVKQLSHVPFLLDPHKIFPISRDKNNSIVVQFEIPEIDGLTGPVQIDQVGLRVVLAKSKKTGDALGSLAVQTVTGAKDSRLVIKIGALNFRDTEVSRTSGGLLEHDFLRFRVRWSEMKVTLKDTEEDNKRYEENRTAIRKYLEHHNVNSVEVEKRLLEARTEYNQNLKSTSFPDVAQIILHRFTVDFQRIFKEDEHKAQGLGLPSNERSQFSVVIHNVQIKDCSPNTLSPNVFDSSSDKSFFDLCLRTRGPLNADLIRVDLFDLNLAYGDGKAEKITVNTGEDFIWRILDIANRTMLATAELAGVDLDLTWNDEAGKFSVTISDPAFDDLDSDGNYQPPRSDKLYDVKKLRVSPFVLLLSFKRQPQSSRYAIIRGVRGAKLTNYFTTRLKFTVDRAELHFQGYMVRDIKGPPDRLADTIKTVYVTQLKTKMVTLMTATSIQDWKYLTARDSGGEEFIEGDLLRMTGNLAGRSAKFVLKKSGDFIGESVMAVTGTIGGGIQDVSETIGVGAVGAGVNSLVSGLGEGVSSTVKGVGTGAGDIVRGAGKGIGQVIGGIGGGAQLVAKGFGRGITTGDMSGVGEGFASMGSGVGQGVETAVEGTVSGVLSVGKGVFSGVKSVGKGIGGVFSGGQQQQQRDTTRKSDSSRK